MRQVLKVDKTLIAKDVWKPFSLLKPLGNFLVILSYLKHSTFLILAKDEVFGPKFFIIMQKIVNEQN